MANPVRQPDPRYTDPVNPIPPLGSDPLAVDPILNPANTQDPRVVHRVEQRSAGSGVMIAAVVLVLAVIAYFIFAPGTTEVTAPTEPATTTEPATPAPAPADPNAAAPAPAEPATPPATEPNATAPTEPATPPAPAPESSAPAPAPAPAQ